MDEETKDLAKTEPMYPARVSGKDGKARGFEDVDVQRDIIMPRVAILQSTSQMVIDGLGRLGELADSLSKENFGSEFTFIPIYHFPTRCKFDIEKGLVCQSRDGLTCTMNSDGKHDLGQQCINCEDAQWPAEGGPDCSLVYNFPALNAVNLVAFPIAISLMKTSSKAGKKLISLAFRSGEDMFSRKYKLYTKKETNDKGTYAVADVELVGRASDEEYAVAKKFYEMLKQRRVDVDLDGEAPKFD